MFTADGNAVIYGGAGDSGARVLDAGSGRELAVLRGHDSDITRVAVSPDGTRIVTGSTDKTVRIWDAHHYDLLLTTRHEASVRALAVASEGKRIQVAGIWNLAVAATWPSSTRAAPVASRRSR